MNALYIILGALVLSFLLAWLSKKWIFQLVESLKILLQLSPAVLDGLLYAAIAFFNALASGIGTDEAAKYIEPTTLFWLRLMCFVFAQTLLALKMFRSTTYSDHLADKKKQSGNTEFITKTTESK